MRKRIGLFHILGRLADDHPELDLPVRLFGSARNNNGIVGTANGRRCFHEDDRRHRYSHPGFRGVIGIVQANTYELSNVSYTRTDSRPPATLGKSEMSMLRTFSIERGSNDSPERSG